MRIESWPLISFILLLIVLIVKINWLKKRGIRVSGVKNTKSRSKAWPGVIFVFLFLIWLFELIRPAFQLGFYILPEWLTQRLFQVEFLQFSGLVLIVIGLTIFTLSLVHFGTSLRFGLEKNNRGKLITRGIFAVSRNPFFLSLDVYFVGIWLMLPSVFHLIFTLSALVGIHFFILKEEQFLAENYGEEYLEYRQNTKRYF
jgi:protein-S-isoprenylcysteine O-methyltransferase Ste14